MIKLAIGMALPEIIKGASTLVSDAYDWATGDSPDEPDTITIPRKLFEQLYDNTIECYNVAYYAEDIFLMEEYLLDMGACEELLNKK